MRILTEAIGDLQGQVIPGEVVFKLYDTFGFPTDLTADIARERDLSIDMPGFELAMEAQRQRARAASKFGSVDVARFQVDGVTGFVGYESLQGQGEVVAVFHGEDKVESLATGDEGVVVLNKTPFYAESGGQVGDTGRLHANGVTFDVLDTVKAGDVFLHKGRLLEGTLTSGMTLEADVDRLSRSAIRLNHSATHLLHAALKQVLGEHVNQRGSLVDSERLRFDFSHFEPVTREEIRTIERIVNEQILRNSAVQTQVMALEDAREKGAMALFGEKYSEEVRVLTMGDDFSVELCGGTHAARTGDIGLFRVTAEQGTASGVRRIEGVTGLRALGRLELLEDTMSEAAALLRADRTNIQDKIKALLEQNKKLEKDVAQLSMKLASGAGNDLAESAVMINGVKVVVNQLDGIDAKTLPDALDRLKNKIQSGIIVLACVNDGKVAMIAGVTADLTDRVNAGALINHVATQVGGKGGGRPDMARAGGTEPAALTAALDSVPVFLQGLLGAA
jgi:alanyl-tRNA synthetase